jgi:hypothetical protein
MRARGKNKVLDGACGKFAKKCVSAIMLKRLIILSSLYCAREKEKIIFFITYEGKQA